MRGVRWGSGDARVLFLHEPAAEKDLDDWGDLPLRLAMMLDASSVVLDLPGHGLSDDPWEPERLSEIVTALVGESTTEQPLLIVAARESATAALAAAADHAVAAVATLSPSPGTPESTLLRSPATAKLFFAGAQDGNGLADSRKLASTLGGWTVVTSIPTTSARGTDMLATEWGPRLREHIIAFARDVLFRQQAPRPLRQSSLPDR
jgi:pimeloyl-ACP methyl ester carboxylesterase